MTETTTPEPLTQWLSTAHLRCLCLTQWRCDVHAVREGQAVGVQAHLIEHRDHAPWLIT